LVAVLVGAAVLALLGLIDDRYDLPWRTKLPIMLLVAVGIVATGVQARFSGSALIDVPMTIIWIIVLTNAANYLDNMDGQSTGMVAIAALFLLLIAFTQNLSLVSLLAAAVLGSALGFLVYNFTPSSTFIGDMGVLPLGFILSVLAIKLEYDQPFSLRWFIPIFVLVLPVLDFTLVTITRPLEGRSPAEAGKDHTAHRLMSIGFGQRAVLAVVYSFCVLFGLLALLVSAAPPEIALRLVVFGLLLMAVLAALLVWIRQRYQKQPPAPRVTIENTPAEMEKISQRQVQ
jgi:UDP-GlcNAc:undecaprenyl-phosphate GlcNAc-1-phosphate transferase